MKVELHERYGIVTHALGGDPARVQEWVERLAAERLDRLAQEERRKEQEEHADAAVTLSGADRLDAQAAQAETAAQHEPDPADRDAAAAQAGELRDASTETRGVRPGLRQRRSTSCARRRVGGRAGRPGDGRDAHARGRQPGPARVRGSDRRQGGEGAQDAHPSQRGTDTAARPLRAGWKVGSVHLRCDLRDCRARDATTMITGIPSRNMIGPPATVITAMYMMLLAHSSGDESAAPSATA